MINYLKFFSCVFSILLIHVVNGQTLSSDMFDGWGKHNMSIYFENDALNLGNLNSSDANYSQGLRIESLWAREENDTKSRFFRTFSLSLRANSENAALLIYTGKAPHAPIPADAANYFVASTRAGLDTCTQYLVIHDRGLPKDIVQYTAQNGRPDSAIYDAVNHIIVLRAAHSVYAYTGWPDNIGNYVPTTSDACIIQVLSDDPTDGSDLLVWFPAEFYESHRFYTHVTGDILAGAPADFFDTPRLLHGALLPTNMFPNVPDRLEIPKTSLKQIKEYAITQDRNRDGVSVLNGYAVGQFIYTPTELVRNGPGQDIREVKKALGGAYRPVVGLLFLSVNAHSKRQNTGEFLFTEAKIGVWGKYSYAREVQGAFHGIIGYVDNPVYKYQLDPRIPLFFQMAANYRKEIVNSSYGLNVAYVTGIDLGTLMANANAGILIKVGHFENQRLIKYSYNLNSSRDNLLGRNLKFFGYAKPTVNVVAMNGLLSSSLFSSKEDNEEKLLPLSSINPVFLKIEAGVGVRIAEQVTVAYTFVSQGPEYTGQPNNMYARVFIRVDY
jgi:hypothetical protein